MKKLNLLIVLCTMLCSCVAPNYYSYNQRIPLNNLIDTQGMSLDQVRSVEILVDEKPVSKSKIVYDEGEFVLLVNRCSDDRVVSVLDEQGIDHKILLRSQITNDKWAYRTGFDGEDISAGYLMVPTNTAINFKENDFYKFIIALPFSLVADILNMVILGPSTALINPWYEYVVEEQ